MMKKFYILGICSALLAVSAAMPALAEESMTTTSSVTTGTASSEMMKRRERNVRGMNRVQGERERGTRPVQTSSDVSGAAVAALVTARENAIIAAHQEFFNAWISARMTLSTQLSAAWNGEASARRKAIMNARKAYPALLQKARKDRIVAVNAATKTFRDEMKKLSPSASVAAEANADAMSAGVSDVQ